MSYAIDLSTLNLFEQKFGEPYIDKKYPCGLLVKKETVTPFELKTFSSCYLQASMINRPENLKSNIIFDIKYSNAYNFWFNYDISYFLDSFTSIIQNQIIDSKFMNNVFSDRVLKIQICVFNNLDSKFLNLICYGLTQLITHCKIKNSNYQLKDFLSPRLNLSIFIGIILEGKIIDPGTLNTYFNNGHLMYIKREKTLNLRFRCLDHRIKEYEFSEFLVLMLKAKLAAI